MHISHVSGWVPIRYLAHFLATDLCELIQRPILSDSLKISIDHRVGISLSALNPETTMEEPSVY